MKTLLILGLIGLGLTVYTAKILEPDIPTLAGIITLDKANSLVQLYPNRFSFLQTKKYLYDNKQNVYYGIGAYNTGLQPEV